MKRAMFMRRVCIGAGDALLYKLSDPVEYKKDEKTNDVVVSAAIAPNGNKNVVIFPSDENGEILGYDSIVDLEDTLDHEEALVKLGYQIM